MIQKAANDNSVLGLCRSAIAQRVRSARDRGKVLLAGLGYHSKPRFLIIGAQKAGTTALFEMLGQHPQVVAPSEKEMDYFDGVKLAYGDPLPYHLQFPPPHRLLPDKLTFEASPNYLYHPDCPKRIFEYSPAMRLIAVLREPVARAFSAWQMHQRWKENQRRKEKGRGNLLPYARGVLTDGRSFEQVVRDEVGALGGTTWSTNPIGYVKRGIYVEQLQRYFEYFKRDSVLVLEQGELARDTGSVLRRVCAFLGIDDGFHFRRVVAHKGRYTGEISAGARDMLASLYKPYNEKLFALLGWSYDW